MTEVSHIENEGETPVKPLLAARGGQSVQRYGAYGVADLSRHHGLSYDRGSWCHASRPAPGKSRAAAHSRGADPTGAVLPVRADLPAAVSPRPDSQLVLLARKTLEFDISVRQLEPTSRRTHPLRLELHNFFFVQGVAGPHRSAIMSLFLHSMSWLTLAILPVVLLLFIQISFLAYHDPVITWTHRIALLLDIGVLVLIGVFLMRAETSFFQAFWRTSISHPFSFLITFVVLAFAAPVFVRRGDHPRRRPRRRGAQVLQGRSRAKDRERRRCPICRASPFRSCGAVRMVRCSVSSIAI